MSTLRVDTLQSLDNTVTVDIADLDNILASTAYIASLQSATPGQGAAQVAQGVRTLATVASLLATTSNTPAKYTYLGGYYAQGDGGSGWLYYDAADTTTASDGGSVFVAADGGRHKRLHTGFLTLKQFGARGNWNGTTGNNDTTFVQAAINWAQTTGNELHVPALAQGFSYQLTAPLVVKRGFKFKGFGAEPMVGLLSTTGVNVRGAGSWFHINHTGVGIYFNGDDGATTGASGAELVGVGTFRTQPTPVPAVAFTPTAHDFDIDVMRFDVKLKDVVLLNPTKAILHRDGSFGRLTCENVRGQPLSLGIELRETFDVCRITGVHWWPFWSNVDSVETYTSINMTQFQLGRVDNAIFDGCFGIFSRRMFNIVTSGAGPVSKAKISNCDADGTGSLITISADTATIYVTNTSQQASTRAAVQTALGAGASGIEWSSGNDGRMYLDNVSLIGANKSCITMFNGINRIIASNLELGLWGVTVAAAVGIDIQGNNNKFELSGPPYITGVSGGAGAVIGGAGAALATVRFPLGSGIASGVTTNGSGDVTITIPDHGIGPRKVSCTTTGATAATFALQSATGTSFTVRVFGPTGAAIISTAVNFVWTIEY